MLAAILDIPPDVGYAAVFLLIAIETMGIPVPGETALVAGALLAANGHLDIVVLCCLASLAAILGDNVGFTIGRTGGRRLFLRSGPFLRQRVALLDKGEPFFARHGPKAVFLGRWVGTLRIASAWLAGMNRMNWPTFLMWNALGGICWAFSVGLAAYYAGEAAEHVLKVAGLAAAIAFVAGLVALLVWRHRRSARDE